MVWRYGGCAAYICVAKSIFVVFLLLAIQPFEKMAIAQVTDSLTTLSEIRQSVMAGSEDEWLGKRVRIGGIVNVATGLLHERYLQIFVQNDSVGLSVFSEYLNQSLAPGDSLIVRGRVEEYYGLVEVVAEDYKVFPETNDTVKLCALKQAMEAPGRYEGMLVKGSGVVRSKGNHANGKYLMVALNDTSRQSIMVYVSNFHAFYQDFDFENLSTGDDVTITGVLSKHVDDFPSGKGYNILLRVPSDLEYDGIPKIYFWYSILTASGIFVLILAWIWMLKLQVGRQTHVIKKALRDKEILLQEIHHRVKNNLAIISGLIELQQDSTSDEAAIQVLKDSQVRIQAMALVHEKLYTSTMDTNVQMDVYIKELVEAIHQTFIEKHEYVEIDFQLEPVKLNLQQVIPCGLLINELVVNAFKHAFKEKENGCIRLSLRQQNGQVELIVADNGAGMSKNVSVKQTDSLGLMLIQTFADQLSAEMKLDGDDGTSYMFLFRHDAE